MQVRDLMRVAVPKVRHSAPVSDVVASLADGAVLWVLGEDDRVIGQVTASSVLAASGGREGLTVGDVMTPFSEMVALDPDMDVREASALVASSRSGEVPVLDRGELIGTIRAADLLAGLATSGLWPPTDSGPAATTVSQASAAVDPRESYHNNRAATILRSLSEGLIVIDSDFIIREYNPAAERLLGRRAEDRIGKKVEVISKEESPVFRIMKTGRPRYGVVTPLADGRTFSVNYVPLVEGGRITGLIQTFHDVTEHEQLKNDLLASREEIDRAFALTLPNSKVEYKLKNTPEYRDKYDPETGLIEVTEVIQDGSYRHVVNALKVLADLNNKGIMTRLGINKDVLVQSIIFHDLGKSQPILKVGDVVDPKQVFEESTRHAQRSADIADAFYHRDPEVVTLIKYHHHKESELPESFPSALRIMLRLFQTLDGLSAALTRRNATLRVDLNGTRILVREQNTHPDYNGSRTLDLFTGQWEVS